MYKPLLLALCLIGAYVIYSTAIGIFGGLVAAVAAIAGVVILFSICR